MGRLVGHMSCKRGKHVSIRLKSGEIINGIFKEKTHKAIILGDGKKIQNENIASFMLAKHVRNK